MSPLAPLQETQETPNMSCPFARAVGVYCKYTGIVENWLCWNGTKMHILRPCIWYTLSWISGYRRLVHNNHGIPLKSMVSNIIFLAHWYLMGIKTHQGHWPQQHGSDSNEKEISSWNVAQNLVLNRHDTEMRRFRYLSQMFWNSLAEWR